MVWNARNTYALPGVRSHEFSVLLNRRSRNQ
jgi:hypothetical protein